MLRYISLCLFSCAADPCITMSIIVFKRIGWSTSMRGLPGFCLNLSVVRMSGWSSQSLASLDFFSYLAFLALFWSVICTVSFCWSSPFIPFYHSSFSWSVSRNPIAFLFNRPTKSPLIRAMSYRCFSWAIALLFVEVVAYKLGNSPTTFNPWIWAESSVGSMNWTEWRLKL